MRKVVPAMTIIYLISTIIGIAMHINNIPNAICLIIKSAFSPAPVMGGFAGATINMYMQMKRIY